MKALKFRSPGGLAKLEVTHVAERAQPNEGEILVRIKASSLNGHDLNVAKGILPVAEGRVLLTDGAGFVEAVGQGVREFAVGDRVVSTFFPDWRDGEAPAASFARTPGDGLDGYGIERVVRPSDWFTRMPQGWSFAEAATLPTSGLTAWRALVIEGELQAGQTALLLGTGGVSVFALQVARQLGARVIVTSSSDEKLERSRTLGAEETINYRKQPDWETRVLDVTGGRGVDLVLETGGPGTLPQSIQATRIGGRIVLVGVLTGIKGNIPTAALMGRQQRLQGITVGSVQQQIAMIKALEQTKIRPYIDRTFAFDDVREAFELQAAASHFGKICIEI